MYYILFETGNNRYFCYIMGKFSSLVVNSVIDKYHNNVFKPSSSKSLVDAEVNKILEENEKDFVFINCALFPKKCKVCMDDHKVVFDSAQVENASKIMTRAIKKILKEQKNDTTRDRANIQTILNKLPDIPDIKERRAIKERRTITVKIHHKDWNPHKVYLDAYIEGTNKLAGQAAAYVYVRATSGSDYGDFSTRTALTPLSPCNSLR